MAFPLVVRAIRLGIESVDRQTEEAAATLGASPAWTFATITFRSRFPECSRASRSGSLKRSASSARRSLSSRTSRARRARSRWRSSPSSTSPAATRSRCAWPGSRSPSPWGARGLGVAQPLREARSSMSLVVEIDHDFGGLRLDVALSLDSRLTAIVGPSGSGKTTILNVIAGVLRPDRALVRIDGEAVADTTAGVWRPAAPAGDRVRVPGAETLPAPDRPPEPDVRTVVQQTVVWRHRCR